jgi:hypothetical protein
VPKKNSAAAPLTPAAFAPKRVVFHGQSPSDEKTPSPAPRTPAVSSTRRIFLISPANTSGVRWQRIVNGKSQSPLALRLRETGAPLAEIFSFMSTLYFRGKLDYAQKFSKPPDSQPGIYLIAPSRGLLLPTHLVNIDDMANIAAVRALHTNPDFRDPLERDARRISAEAGPDTQFILLGSIATLKYVEPLSSVLGSRLHFPAEFLGRGNMSRGSLLFRCCRENRELTYNAVTEDLLRPPKRPKTKKPAGRRKSRKS